MIRLGAHLSISGGYDKALDRSLAIGANTLQIFSGSPRTWKRPETASEQLTNFKTKKNTLDINPVFFHALYLVNLASPTETGQKSVDTLIWELNLAAKMDVAGSVVHLGSYLKNNPQTTFQVLIDNLSLILDSTPNNVSLIIENSAGHKIGQTPDEIFQIINQLKDPRLKICWDTCHGFAAGIDLSTVDKLDRLLDAIDQNVGLERLVLWHLNDSRDPFNSKRDRHANIGEGYIGTQTFANILNHPVANKIPAIIETPGFDNKGPDKKNLDILKGLIKKA
ncbi:MAG: deoxyribonuclease IV [bacterium]|nr:deoxyribonuclease IV [bacterium]